MLEIEVKYRLQNTQMKAIERKIAALELKQQAVSRQIDAIFLEKKHTSFATFTQGDPVARVRVDGGNVSMTVKKSVDDTTRIEHEMSCGDYEVACNIFRTLGYNQIVEVSKERVECHGNRVVVTLDKVKNLGDFIEIEVLAQNEEQKPTALAEIAKVAESLGLRDDMIETRKYDEMLTALNI